jgi:hypothetical protein
MSSFDFRSYTYDNGSARIDCLSSVTSYNSYFGTFSCASKEQPSDRNTLFCMKLQPYTCSRGAEARAAVVVAL